MQPWKQPIVQQMINQRRLARIHGYRIKRWKLPLTSIIQLERETERQINAKRDFILLFGSQLIQSD